MFNQATLNLGIGNGRFQSVDNQAAGENGMGVFASGALRVNSWSSAIFDYTGAALNLAYSFTPSATMPLVVTPSLNDVTGAGNGRKGRLALGVGYSWKY